MEKIAKIIQHNQAFNITIHVDAALKVEPNSAQILAWKHLLREIKMRPNNSQERYKLIVDRTSKREDFERKDKIRDFVSNLTEIKNSEIISEPLFCDSELTSIIQLADFCAWMSRRLNCTSSNFKQKKKFQHFNEILDPNVKAIFPEPETN